MEAFYPIQRWLTVFQQCCAQSGTDAELCSFLDLLESLHPGYHYDNDVGDDYRQTRCQRNCGIEVSTCSDAFQEKDSKLTAAYCDAYQR